jgi:branched-chain amino acid transport system ATP-binding protein
MLLVKGLTACYGPLTALSGIELDAPQRCRLGIFGHNGAGKTTLLRCIVGAHAPTSGSVAFEGVGVAPGHVAEVVRRGIAFVPQGHNVFPNLSVEQNIRVAGLHFDQSFSKEVYRLFPVLDERRPQRAGSMSGGEQQMLALGMALMTQPRLLLLDEPLTGLAPIIVEGVMRRLLDVNAAFGTGFIIVEQNVPATLKAIDQAVILKSGAVVFRGEAGSLATQSKLWEWF